MEMIKSWDFFLTLRNLDSHKLFVTFSRWTDLILPNVGVFITNTK